MNVEWRMANSGWPMAVWHGVLACDSACGRPVRTVGVKVGRSTDFGVRLLDKWLAGGLSHDEQAQLPPGLIAAARRQLEAKVRDGLDALERGEWVDGDEFLARWKARLAGQTPEADGAAPQVQRRA